MGNGTRQPLPKAREDRLLVENLADEVLVYDGKRHKAHCLNQTAAIVWKHCDGQTAVPEIARRVQHELKTPVGEDVVWLALDALGRNHLLQEQIERAPGAAGLSRRDAMKVGLAGAGALPLVTSILAPTIAQAATLGTVPPGVTLPPGVTVPPEFTFPPGVTVPPEFIVPPEELATVIPGCIPVSGADCMLSGRLPNGNQSACLDSRQCCSCCCHTNTGLPADAHCANAGGVAGCLVLPV
jgi:Coenzyme PQQ synthesis protein D (PqqD)